MSVIGDKMSENSSKQCGKDMFCGTRYINSIIPSDFMIKIENICHTL